MRTIILAGTFMALLCAAPAIAQDGAGSAPGDTQVEAAVGAGLSGIPDDTTWANNRVYALPPEVDVETTGSVSALSCVGETMGQRLCQDGTDSTGR